MEEEEFLKIIPEFHVTLIFEKSSNEEDMEFLSSKWYIQMNWVVRYLLYKQRNYSSVFRR